MKLADTPKGRQAGGLALIHYDLEFAARAFGSAAEIKEATESKEPLPHTSPHVLMKILQAADPILRKGGVLSIVDANREPTQSIWASSLFEAAVARYARCFNSGKRTVLSSSFSGPTARFRKLHREIMDVRNSLVAHAGMEHEECMVGFQNVCDPNYGVRPSTQFSLLTMRTPTPEPARLRELSEHCIGIDGAIVLPRLEKCVKNLREEILAMKESEIDQLENFIDYKHKLQKVFAGPDPSQDSTP